MEKGLQIKKCKEGGCSIDEDGLCMDGFDKPSECPHFYYLDADEEEMDINSAATETKTISFFSGDELTLSNVHTITHRSPAKLVYLIGEHDCGKTTILATLFDMFHLGPFHQYNFAGSYTQVGFEKRCFYSRVESDLQKADTERTRLEDFKFLHLALKTDVHKKDFINILLSDISGEKFKRSRNSSEEMQELLLTKNADCINYVIDGEKLSDPRKRFAAINQSRTFLQKAFDNGVFDSGTDINIIVSKWDLLQGVEEFDFDQQIKIAFSEEFEHKFRTMKFFKIAVRPESFNKGFELAHGLLDLLNNWVSVRRSINKTLPVDVKYDRMFNNFPYGE